MIDYRCHLVATALHVASLFGHPWAVTALLAAGAA